MIEKILEFAQKFNMFGDSDAVVCGLSGGADSVCLLLSLYHLREKLGIEVEALHVNHCLRGAESDRDEQFCRELCRKNSIPFTAVQCDVNSYAEKNNLSVEETARKLRYEIFEQYSQGKKIATAHNANDNLETIILNLARGTALKGLAGIPPVRGNIVRPLLTVSRQEIESFLENHTQDYVTDSTNLSDDYTRNKIRHRIIPVLQELNRSVVETSVKSADALRSENDFIELNTESALSQCRKENKFINLKDFHEVVRRRCIAVLLSENNIPYSYKRLSEADNILMNGGKINVSNEFFLVSDGNCFELKQIPDVQEFVSTELKLGENSIFPDKIINCELILCDNFKKNNFVHKKLTFYLLDYDKIKGKAVIRCRKYGDKIQLRGRNFTSSVKKLINERVPQNLRSTMHFIEDEQGTVFAEHIGIAERVAPDESSVRLLRITVY